MYCTILYYTVNIVANVDTEADAVCVRRKVKVLLFSHIIHFYTDISQQ